ncbi:MAG: glycosyltransferase [Actinobacteria bacterium]|nr:glycosyltransferase [Actinomycetota bacterium]
MRSSAGPIGAESTRPAVGILVTDNRRRGAEVQAERTAEGLNKLGWEVEFRSLASSPEPVVGAPPLTAMRRSDLGRFNPSLVRPTRQFLRRNSNGVVLAWGSLTVRYVAAAAAALRHRPRLGYVSIGSPLAWVSGRRGIAQYRLLAGRYDFIIAVSDRTKHELVDAIGIPLSKITVIRSGVPERFLTLPRQEHDGPTRVLFVGSLSAEKDPIAAVTAFGIAADEADLQLTIVGDGPLREATEESVAARHLGGRVEFVGSVADIEPHLVWADALLLTSTTEGLPGVLIEAAAAGLPAVAYGVGAVDEVIEDGSSGIVVRDRTVESAARALITLARDRDLRRRLGERARVIAGKRFLMGSAVDATDRLLRHQLV